MYPGDLIRWYLTLIVLHFVYFEAGPITMVCLFWVAIAVELVGFALRNHTQALYSVSRYINAQMNMNQELQNIYSNGEFLNAGYKKEELKGDC